MDKPGDKWKFDDSNLIVKVVSHFKRTKMIVVTDFLQTFFWGDCVIVTILCGSIYNHKDFDNQSSSPSTSFRSDKVS